MSILLDNSIDATICIFNYLPSKDLINMGNTCKTLFDVTEEKYVKDRKQWENYIKDEYWRNNITSIDVEKISAMTCICNINTSVQLNRIDNYLIPRNDKHFINCKEYLFQNKHLKFYASGNVQLTRCKTIDECINILKFFCDEIKVRKENIANFKIALITYSDIFSKRIDLHTIHNNILPLKSRIGRNLLSIKLKKAVITIFSNGKYVILSDLQTLKNCVDTIDFINNLFL